MNWVVKLLLVLTSAAIVVVFLTYTRSDKFYYMFDKTPAAQEDEFKRLNGEL